MNVAAAKVVASGLAIISLAGPGVGIGVVFGCLIIAIGRQPSLRGPLFSHAILGFALTEAIALFGIMMAFLFLFAL